jgi:NAD(P)-dependent dehydrogenase (short-subunit alcohol dehydrogenase family)
VRKTILIAPFEGPLAAALAERASAAGWRTVLGLARRQPPQAAARSAETVARASDPPSAPTPAGAASIPYDPRSCASAAALVISAANALGDLGAAVIVAGPASAKADFPAGKPADIAQLVDERCAGPLYLAREIVRRFEDKGFGRILLFAQESPRDAEAGPAAAMSYGAFEGLGRGLFAASVGGAWSAYGLRDSSGAPDRAARFALELLEEPRPSKAGRWMRFSGKSGLFG